MAMDSLADSSCSIALVLPLTPHPLALSLKENSIGDAGASALAEALKQNNTRNELE